MLEPTNMIRYGEQKSKPNDIDSVTKADIESFRQNLSGVSQVTPYGFFSSPPVGSKWILFASRCNANDVIGIANDYKNRPKGLKEGEVMLCNTTNGARIKIDEMGRVIILNCTGVLVDGCDVTVSGGDVIADTISLKNHVHGGVQSGILNTLPPS